MPRQPSPAIVVALIALAVALSGTAYAGLTIRSGDVVNNSLRSADVRDNSLTRADVRENTLGSGDIRNGTLLRRDFRASDLAALRGATGATGPAGPAGPAGATGPTGPPGAPATTLFASVNDNGTLARGKGGPISGRAGQGLYDVRFPGVDVTTCVPHVTIGSDSAVYVPALASATAGYTTDDNVRMRITDDAGAAFDRPFYLAILC
jgi:hypothetical protein